MLTFEQLTNLAKCSYQRMIRYNSKEEKETFNMFKTGFNAIKPEGLLWNFEEAPKIGLKVTISRDLYEEIYKPVNPEIENPEYTRLCRIKYNMSRYHLPLIVFYIDFDEAINLQKIWSWLEEQGSVHILEHYGIPQFLHNKWLSIRNWYVTRPNPNNDVKVAYDLYCSHNNKVMAIQEFGSFYMGKYENVETFCAHIYSDLTAELPSLFLNAIDWHKVWCNLVNNGDYYSLQSGDESYIFMTDR